MIIDTHVHLNMPPLSDTWPEVLAAAEAVGVSPVIVPGASLETSRIAVEQAGQDERIFAAVGIHPEEKIQDSRFMIQELRKLATRERVVAIGECGLDYFRGIVIKDQQKELFTHQVLLAQELTLPLIIHTRTEEAMNDAVEILRESRVKMVFHCFSGDLAFWKLIEPLGALVGVGATITYPKNEHLRETIRQIPLERIVMETDAPWLPPQTMRGQINTPANVRISGQALAEIKQVQLDEVMEVTTKNAKEFFNINLG